ncbi:MAG TPA: SCO family protein, partial [Humisphaera sp.]
PPAVAEATVDERPANPLPLDAAFRDEAGAQVTLRTYLDGRKPAVVVLGYYGCPMLCGLVANGAAEALRGVDLKAGTDYEVVFVSIDPAEGPDLAKQKKAAYAAANPAAGSWHFLTGDGGAIARLTDATGFRYRWIESAQQWAHPAVIVVATPDGRVSRYLYGVRWDPPTVRLSLVEASEGRVGSASDKLILTCFQYDGKQGKYAMTAIGVMKIGGGLTVAAVGGGIGLLALHGRRRRRERDRQQEQQRQGGSPDPSGGTPHPSGGTPDQSSGTPAAGPTATGASAS